MCEIGCLALMSDSLSRRTTAMLYQFLTVLEGLLQQGYTAAKAIQNSEHLSPILLDDDSSDSDDSECDYD